MVISEIERERTRQESLWAITIETERKEEKDIGGQDVSFVASPYIIAHDGKLLTVGHCLLLMLL